MICRQARRCCSRTGARCMSAMTPRGQAGTQTHFSGLHAKACGHSTTTSLVECTIASMQNQLPRHTGQ